MEEQQQSHTIVMQEKLRLLESQVAGLMSDVFLLKAWKTEMSKLWSPVIKQEPVDTDTTAEMSYDYITEKNEYVVVGLKQEVPELEETAMEEGVPDTESSILDVQKAQAESETTVEQSKEEDSNEAASITTMDVLEHLNQPSEGYSRIVSIQNTVDTQKTESNISEIAIPVKEDSSIDPNKNSVNMQKAKSESDGIKVEQSKGKSQAKTDTTAKHSKEEESDATANQPKEGIANILTVQNKVDTQRMESNIIELVIQPVKEESRTDPNKDSVDMQKTESENDVVPLFLDGTAKQSKHDGSSAAIIQSMVGTQEVDGITKQCAEEQSNLDPNKDSLNKLKIEPETDARTEQTKEIESSAASIKSTVDVQKVNAAAKQFKEEESRINLNKALLGIQKTDSETGGHKNQSTEESIQDASIAATDEPQKELPTTDSPAKRSKRDSWIDLIEEEEHHALPVKIENSSASEQVIASSCASQNEDSSLPSLLAKLIKSSTDTRNFNAKQKQNTEVPSSELENNKTEKQKSMMLIPKSPLKDKNINITDTSSVDSKQKRMPEKEEEGEMVDVSVNIKDKKCAMCQCKIPAHKVSQVPEEDCDILEETKKMNLKQLQKKYLDLHKRHEKLVNGICDPNCIVVPDDKYALLNAARDGDVDEAILLTFNDTMMSFCDEDGYLPLHLAVWSGHRLICRLLLGYNMPVNAKDNQGNTPLHFASRKGNVDICKLLLEWNAALNATNNFGSTPLHCAAKEGQEDVCCLLVSNGALVNLNDKWNNMPLHMAACNGHLNICRLLIQHGAELNVQNNVGNTPLHNACKAGHLEVVQHLVKKGARSSVQCIKGKTPREVMKTFENARALEWLEKWEKRTCTDIGKLLSSF